MGNLLQGAQYLLRGFGLIQRKGVRHYAYLPIAINTILFSFAIWYGINGFDQWMVSLMLHGCLIG